jgi:(S)-2-hydroxyglutarate dehydrogenase
MHDVVVIGGGIVGLATALAVIERQPGTTVVVIEKESVLAKHQTGNNSGVIHAGVYYKPGSLKATYCREGNAFMVEFCKEHGIPYDVCGKLIVATSEEELPRLAALEDKATAHGLAFERLGPAGLKEHEPHVAGIAGIYIPSTGITNYTAVVNKYAELVVAGGGEIRLNTRVGAIRREAGVHLVETSAGVVRARSLVNCAGLHSDRVAKQAGASPEGKIVPFRGEYYELSPQSRHLVNGLIYPVPDPNFPFLGVHLTKMIDGSVHAGPNAVLALKREGYRKRDVSLRDTFETLTYSGFLRLARNNFADGMQEVARSFSKRLFLKSLQRLVPAVQLTDLVPAHAGVRAQALTPEGGLVDDFSIIESESALHVCNAPSPAATSSMIIGRAIADRLGALVG